MSAPQKMRQGLNPALLRVTRTCLNWFWRLDGPGLSYEQGGQETASPFSPSRATTGPVDGTTAGSPKSTKDPASSSSESSRGNVDDSDMDTASGDCISCSDIDEVSVQTAHKKYRKRV